MNINLKVWRQKNGKSQGKLVDYKVENVSPDMSFLEMFDVLNDRLINEGKDEPIAFDHDCREGICGSCSMYINGRPHGPNQGVTTCQLHMRKFKAHQFYTYLFHSSASYICMELLSSKQLGLDPHLH